MQYNVKDDVHIAYMGEGQVKLIHAHVDQWNVYIMKTNCKEKQGVIIIGAIIVSLTNEAIIGSRNDPYGSNITEKNI